MDFSVIFSLRDLAGFYWPGLADWSSFLALDEALAFWDLAPAPDGRTVGRSDGESGSRGVGESGMADEGHRSATRLDVMVEAKPKSRRSETGASDSTDAEQRLVAHVSEWCRILPIHSRQEHMVSFCKENKDVKLKREVRKQVRTCFFWSRPRNGCCFWYVFGSQLVGWLAALPASLA